jgi:hypothetical protein
MCLWRLGDSKSWDENMQVAAATKAHVLLFEAYGINMVAGDFLDPANSAYFLGLNFRYQHHWGARSFSFWCRDTPTL